MSKLISSTSRKQVIAVQEDSRFRPIDERIPCRVSRPMVARWPWKRDVIDRLYMSILM